MAGKTVELDFFGVLQRATEEKPANSRLPPSLDGRRSFRGISDAISKISPELLKSVVGSMPMTHSGDNLKRELFPAQAVIQSPLTGSNADHGNKISPLTIFYNGTVLVFDVTHDKAETILKLAVEGSLQNQLRETLSGDLPVARRMSLQRFLKKRKERLNSAQPYTCCSR